MFKALLFSALLLSHSVIADSFIEVQLSNESYQWKKEVLTESLRLSTSDSFMKVSQDNGYAFIFSTGHDYKRLKPGIYKSSENSLQTNSIFVENYPNYSSCYPAHNEFTVYEYDLSSKPNKVALDFVRTCVDSNLKLRGVIRVNSDVPHPTPYPVAVIDGDTITTEAKTITLTGAESFSLPGKIVSYHWTQNSGKAARMQNIDSPQVQIQLPTGIILGGEKASFRLTVTDNMGIQDSEDVTLHIASKSDRQTYIEFSSEPEDLIGRGRTATFNLNNSLFTSYATAFGSEQGNIKGVYVNALNDANWELNFEAPSNKSMSKRFYSYALHTSSQLESRRDAAILDITSGNDRCIDSVGSFNVTELELDLDRDMPDFKSFKASFEHRCNYGTGALLKGVVAINALPDNVPMADAGKNIEVFENSRVHLDASASHDVSGSIQEFYWQLNNINIDNANQAKASFIAPALANRQYQKEYFATLKVVDNEGYQALDKVKITVLQNNKAPVANDDSATMAIGETIKLPVLNNDIDIDGDIQPATLTIEQQTAKGKLFAERDGTITFVHTGTEAGDVTFKYSVEDNDGKTSNTATVRLKVKKPGQSDAESSGGTTSLPLLSMLLVLLLTRRLKKQ